MVGRKGEQDGAGKGNRAAAGEVGPSGRMERGVRAGRPTIPLHQTLNPALKLLQTDWCPCPRVLSLMGRTVMVDGRAGLTTDGRSVDDWGGEWVLRLLFRTDKSLSCCAVTSSEGWRTGFALYSL